MSAQPVFFFIILVLLGIFYSARVIQILETPSEGELELALKNGNSHRGFLNSVWQMVITLTVVGYGDIFPISTMGKMIVFICSLYGIIILSVMVTVLTKQLNMAVNVDSAYLVIERLQQRRKVERKAATIICLWYRIVRLNRKKPVPINQRSSNDSEHKPYVGSLKSFDNDKNHNIGQKRTNSPKLNYNPSTATHVGSVSYSKPFLHTMSNLKKSSKLSKSLKFLKLLAFSFSEAPHPAKNLIYRLKALLTDFKAEQISYWYTDVNDPIAEMTRGFEILKGTQKDSLDQLKIIKKMIRLRRLDGIKKMTTSMARESDSNLQKELEDFQNDEDELSWGDDEMMSFEKKQNKISLNVPFPQRRYSENQKKAVQTNQKNAESPYITFKEPEPQVFYSPPNLGNHNRLSPDLSQRKDLQPSLVSNHSISSNSAWVNSNSLFKVLNLYGQNPEPEPAHPPRVSVSPVNRPYAFVNHSSARTLYRPSTPLFFEPQKENPTLESVKSERIYPTESEKVYIFPEPRTLKDLSRKS